MLEIRLYHHEITQRERQLIRAAQKGRTITLLGRKYRVLRVNQIAEPGKHRTELCFEPVGVEVRPQLALTPENYKSLCRYPVRGIESYQKACLEIWERAGMPGTGEFVILYAEGLPPALAIKE